MKKIVALVLAMVMVMGLATVAFAADVTNTVSGKGYEMTEIDATATDLVADADEFKVTKYDVVSSTANGVTTYTYKADKYDFAFGTFYAVDKTCANYQLIKGAAVVYLTDDANAASTNLKVDKVVAKVAEPVCGQSAKDIYVVGEDKYVVAEDGVWVAYNNTYVKLAKVTTEIVAHEWDADTIKYDEDAKPVSIKCSNCKKTFKIVDTTAGLTLNAYEALGGGYYVVFGTAAADAAGDAAVESPKTFDAGIAMYVGMSVMAAAGSAVVLKKKD